MASNTLKTPLQSSANRAAQKQALDAIQLLGKALPCTVVSRSGTIVTVQFAVDATPFTLPNVTMPIGMSEYIRLPLKRGAKGVAYPADVRINSVTGLGKGTPEMITPGNLTALVFFPCGNTGYPAVDDNEAVWLYADRGVSLTDTARTWTFRLTPEGIVIYQGVTPIMTISGSTNSVRITGGRNLIVDGDVIAGAGTSSAVSLLNHRHTGVVPGGGNSGPPLR